MKSENFYVCMSYIYTHTYKEFSLFCPREKNYMIAILKTSVYERESYKVPIDCNAHVPLSLFSFLFYFIIESILQCAFCFVFLAFYLLLFFSFTTVLLTIVFLTTYFLFLLKFVNFYLERHKTKNRISKKARCKK